MRRARLSWAWCRRCRVRQGKRRRLARPRGRSLRLARVVPTEGSSIVCRVERRRLAGPGCAQSDLCKVNGQPTLSCLLIDLSFFNKVSINIPISYCLMDYNFRL